MDVLWTDHGPYREAGFETEADLEAAIARVQEQLFGPGRVYLDVKRRIGGKSGPINIPDGYLIDLSGRTPRLYVVENELAAHDPLRHIAVQILQFSLSFNAEPLAVKRVLLSALDSQPERREPRSAASHIGFEAGEKGGGAAPVAWSGESCNTAHTHLDSHKEDVVSSV